MKARVISVVGILAMVCVAVLIAGNDTRAEISDVEKMAQWGTYLNENAVQSEQISSYALEDSGIYEVGQDINILQTEFDQFQKFYEISGYSVEEAEAMAKKHVEERNALYAEAIKNGYDVSEEEVQIYCDELKEIIATSENSEMYDAVVSSFESEEAYWQYEYLVYQKDLPIQKYVADMEYNYAQQLGLDQYSQDFQDAWTKHFEEWKEQLCLEQNFYIP